MHTFDCSNYRIKLGSIASYLYPLFLDLLQQSSPAHERTRMFVRLKTPNTAHRKTTKRVVADSATASLPNRLTHHIGMTYWNSYHDFILPHNHILQLGVFYHNPRVTLG